MGMFLINESIASSSTIGALANDSCSIKDLNLCICFVIFLPSFIFKVYNLTFKYIFVTTSFDSNMFINSSHAFLNVPFDCT